MSDSLVPELVAAWAHSGLSRFLSEWVLPHRFALPKLDVTLKLNLLENYYLGRLPYQLV